ncbi:MAG: hypothetical protein LM590_15580 [Thermofilum sp.]|nr:hypothetical protein [Thermofilum sp.]
METSISVGEVKIEVLGAEHFCTVCDAFSWRCHSRHRSGNLFVLRVSVPYKEPVLFLISRGEFKEVRSVNVQRVLGELVFRKMSGTEVYERGKITAAGWISFSEPVLRVREEDVNVEQLRKDLTPEERELLYILLDEHKVMLLTKFIAALSEESPLLRDGIHSFIESLDLGVWTPLKPLLHTFASNKVYWINKACITFIPFSFKAQFELGKIKFRVTKARPEIFRLAGYDNVTVVKLGKRRTIYVVDGGERVSVYYELPHVVYAYEQYRDLLHPAAALDPKYFEENKENLFKRRLGDILFTPSESAPSEAKVEQLPDWAGKLRVLQGRIVTTDGNYYVKSDGDIVLYHPEHGTLTLPAGVYRVERVQYLRAGHE